MKNYEALLGVQSRKDWEVNDLLKIVAESREVGLTWKSSCWDSEKEMYDVSFSAKEDLVEGDCFFVWIVGTDYYFFLTFVLGELTEYVFEGWELDQTFHQGEVAYTFEDGSRYLVGPDIPNYWRVIQESLTPLEHLESLDDEGISLHLIEQGNLTNGLVSSAILELLLANKKARQEKAEAVQTLDSARKEMLKLLAKKPGQSSLVAVLLDASGSNRHMDRKCGEEAIAGLWEVASLLGINKHNVSAETTLLPRWK